MVATKTGAGRLTAAALAVVAGAISATVDARQTTGPKIPPLVIESMYGPDLFRMYCASCHGRDAKGNGPVATALKVPPPDLTVLSRRQNGVFPEKEVEAVITGTDAIPAHGSDEMPVWGLIFRALDSNNDRAKARIKNLVAHVRSIQQR